ncbi:MAG TPA: NifU N-terminal domain-containing protein, partial [Salinimicrobium sp.]|nr:NifU N-terminal domain-containing protein [Salinimicrobium sp.]
MQSYTINIKPTTKPTIVKFEANKFLTKHENFEFKNIDEAGRSPLAQQLFHLPFVKTVYIAQNFVAIEKYNIVHWKDVQEEVSLKIKDYLNSGGEVITPDAESSAKRIPVTVYAESTPNPGVMKFVANKKLVLETVEFKNIDAAKNAPLARELFHLPFVKEVFIDENYLSISKYDIAEWEDITSELREFIRVFLEEGKDVLLDDAVNPGKTTKEINVPKVNVPEPKHYDSTSKEIIA